MKHRSTAKPKLGQNFLIDVRAQQAIVDALGDVSDRTVVEIGPGHGVLTNLLAARCRRLLAIELDPSLAAELRFRFRDRPQVTIIEADVLTTDLCDLLRDFPAADIIGNLPYYITSDILLHLFAVSERCPLHRAVLMMQREVAERVTAASGVSSFGVLSATTEMHAQAQLLFTLPPSAFSPSPEVDSTVVRLDFASRFAEFELDRAGFLAFLRVSFAQKRKTLANNLRAAGFTPQTIDAAWPPSLAREVRAEAVPIDTMAAIYRTLKASRT